MTKLKRTRDLCASPQIQIDQLWAILYDRFESIVIDAIAISDVEILE